MGKTALLALVVATSCLFVTDARAGEPLKPYVVMILDTSGSMGALPFGAGPTGSGPPSCGGSDTRINHARCAINKIANSYGDMVFALGRFREYTSGTYSTSCDADADGDGNQSCEGAGCTLPVSGGDQCNTQGAYCGDCDEASGLNNTCNNVTTFCSGNDTCVAGRCQPPVPANPAVAGQVPGTCTTADREFELIAPLIDGNNQAAVNVTDFSCGTCAMNAPGSASASGNEIWGVSPNTFTPLAAVLNGAKRYWSGLQATDGTVIWPSGSPGFSPIANDPTFTSFLPVGCNSAPGCVGATCCVSQCRPYITILLTDGAETCTIFSNTTNAASSMLATDVGGRRYHVLTKPIGFGIAPGNAQIEGIAHAGGAADVPGVFEGYYANDETSLQLAISSILDDAIKTELCNNADDDCDTIVDEGFSTGGACDNGQQGVCRRTGTLGCKADGSGVQCSVGPVVPGSEGTVCNNLDDDCDGKIDEGITGCTCIPQGETCNNMDDNCNGMIDEGPITRPCGMGTCQGIETCNAGVFSGCTAPPSGTETCNGLDDDCDGVRDGLTQTCSTMPVNGFPAGDARNNPGAHPGPSPSCISEGPAVCICHPGNKTCPANVGPPNSFGACIGEVQPATEVCNNLDDDCDGRVDEGTGGQDCSTNCGVGTTVCTNGQIMCNGMTAPDDDTCDGNDDDCDGMIDEDYVSPGACGTGLVCNGMERCINGSEQCIGDPIGTESCNCTDDDCDTRIDENSMCPTGSTCTNCQCAFPCAGGEFPCPLGKRCDPATNFCIEDPCFGVDCPDTATDHRLCQVQGNAGVCVNACDAVDCGTLRCVPLTGECAPDTCAAFPDKCAANENCVNNTCVSNPCAGVSCNSGDYCANGACVHSCAGVDCPSNQRCELGQCVDDPCGKQCPAGQVCNDDSGDCGPDPCAGVICAGGQWCDPHGDGSCSDDPCVGTSCPVAGQVCIGGTCDDPMITTNDAGGEEHVTTGGGGGCSSGGDGAGLALALLGLASLRRRRTGGVA